MSVFQHDEPGKAASDMDDLARRFAFCMKSIFQKSGKTDQEEHVRISQEITPENHDADSFQRRDEETKQVYHKSFLNTIQKQSLKSLVEFVGIVLVTDENPCYNKNEIGGSGGTGT